MENSPDPVETLWDRLLSRESTLVRAAFEKLAPEEQQAVLEHLKRMSSEPGWHPQQRLSAQAALAALRRAVRDEGSRNRPRGDPSPG